MNLFPNPSDGDLCIEFNTEWRGTFDVEIMDSKGTLVAAFKREKRDAHWLSHYSNETLARGIYVVRVRAENGSCLSKRWVRL
jgi:Secretion system C-terminal sorting domain